MQGFGLMFKRFGVMMTLSLFSSLLWCLPWFSPFHEGVEQERIPSPSSQNTPLNFSGDWRGQCNGQDAADLSISQQSTAIVLKYGFMEEKYTIGDLHSVGTSNHHQSETGSSSVSWSPDNKALIFFHSQHFMGPLGNVNIFFSTVRMSLEGENLIISGDHYQSSTDKGEVIGEKIQCHYHPKHLN